MTQQAILAKYDIPGVRRAPNRPLLQEQPPAEEPNGTHKLATLFAMITSPFNRLGNAIASFRSRNLTQAEQPQTSLTTKIGNTFTEIFHPIKEKYQKIKTAMQDFLQNVQQSLEKRRALQQQVHTRQQALEIIQDLYQKMDSNEEGFAQTFKALFESEYSKLNLFKARNLSLTPALYQCFLTRHQAIVQLNETLEGQEPLQQATLEALTKAIQNFAQTFARVIYLSTPHKTLKAK